MRTRFMSGAYHFIEKLRVHFHEMTWLGETPFVYIGDVFAEGRDALLLQAAVLREKIAVSLRVAGRAFAAAKSARHDRSGP